MPEFHFSADGASRLASLAGIQADLGRVLEYCGRMVERYAGAHLKKSPFDLIGFNTHVDFIDWEALSTAACVAYARCFVTGIRQKLDESLLQEATTELRNTHEFIIDLRNKHVAHSVNSFEENSVTLHIEDYFVSATEICSAIPRHTRQSGLSFDLPVLLTELVNWWLIKVKEEMVAETEHVLALARQMSIAEIRSHGELKQSSYEERLLRVNKRRHKP